MSGHSHEQKWVHYYWEATKTFGQECYRTWRAELMSSVLVIGFIFLINRASIDLRTGLLASAYTLATMALWHILRVPWLMVQRKSLHEGSLHYLWGVLGAALGLTITFLWLYTAAWFYTMQPKVEFSNKEPDQRDAEILSLQERISAKTIPESPDSLRRRTLRLSDEIEEYVDERETSPSRPPMAIPNSSDPNPAPERKEAIRKYQEYENETQKYYLEHFADKAIGIIREYDAKGVKTGFLENTFRQRPPYIAQAGSVMENLDELSQFRELAYHVDAKDELITIAP